MAEIETIDGGGQTENDVHQRPKTSKSVILEERDEEEKVSKKPKSKLSPMSCLIVWFFDMFAVVSAQSVAAKFKCVVPHVQILAGKNSMIQF